MSLLNSYHLTCPHCLEQIQVVVDTSAGNQEYTEDCEVCCNPISFRITMDGSNVVNIEARRDHG